MVRGHGRGGYYRSRYGYPTQHRSWTSNNSYGNSQSYGDNRYNQHSYHHDEPQGHHFSETERFEQNDQNNRPVRHPPLRRDIYHHDSHKEDRLKASKGDAGKWDNNSAFSHDQNRMTVRDRDPSFNDNLSSRKTKSPAKNSGHDEWIKPSNVSGSLGPEVAGQNQQSAEDLRTFPKGTLQPPMSGSTHTQVRGRGRFNNYNNRRGFFNHRSTARGSQFERQPSRWDNPGNYESNGNDTNEINQWLENRVGPKSLSEMGKIPVNQDPLPGSEEARINAIKEATDRLKQTLSQNKKSVNLNELLSSSGDESKSESQTNKLKSFPKNLAELELDASDMRAIGRANTGATSCVVNENSDDDVVEVARPPTPPRPIIDLDISPIKSSGNSGVNEEKARYRKARHSSAESIATDEDISKSNNTKIPPVNSCRGTQPASSEMEVSRRTSLESRTGEKGAQGNVDKTGPPCAGFGARRRRASSSSSSSVRSTRNSLCDAPDTHFQFPHSFNLTTGSPPCLSRSSHDSRQRKIISDLKKINQSKLKDLVNNPRSGRLEFALKELMKEHRATLSRESRDVAEKRIPAEFLNPKSTELPPDDSALLADFAIDWSSLPGELIYTLGDLFNDIESEAENTHVPISDPGNAFDTDARFSYVAEANTVDKRSDPMDNTSLSLQTSENANSGRIRVRQFAKENQLESRNEEVSQVEGNNESKSGFGSETFTDNMAHLKESENFTMNAGSNNADESTSQRSVGEGSSQVIPEPTRSVVPSFNPLQFREENSRVEESGALKKSGKSYSQAVQCENDKTDFNAVENLSRGSISLVKSNLNKDGKITDKEVRQASRNESNIKKGRQRKLVHLEERSWFDELPSKKHPTNRSDSHCSKGKSREKNPTNADSSELRVESTTVRNPSPQTLAVEEVGNAWNVPAVDREVVSMLPVLMMTVPANSVSDTVCTMTPDEMQKRLIAIDSELQNLVQERFLISQALKVAQSSQENPPNQLMSVTPSSSTEVAQDTPSCSQSVTKNSKTDSIPSKQLGKKLKMSSKRKLDDSITDAKCPKKKRSEHSNQLNLESVTNGSNVIKESVKEKPVKDCFVRLEAISPRTIHNKLTKSVNEIDITGISDGDDVCGTSNQTNVTHESENDESLTDFKIRPLFEGVEGTILDMKLDASYIYAASQNGKVYKVCQRSTKVRGDFGELSASGITCIEILNESDLFTGSADGTLSIYKLKYNGPGIKPNFFCNISNGILCMESNWGFVYIGTQAGSVIPFNVKTRLAGEPLNIGGFPVLSIKTCMEGPRKVLIVASRNQPIAIRDAVSGLFLRSLGGSGWTVYSILLVNSWVFCGTNSDKITVFDFQSGELKFNLQGGRGIIDMKFAHGHLFSASYDGNIYISNVETKQPAFVMSGPGNMILCFCLTNRWIVCSSKDSPLIRYRFPNIVKKHIKRELKKLSLAQALPSNSSFSSNELLTSKKTKKKKKKSKKNNV